MLMRKLLPVFLVLTMAMVATAQRIYTPNSVLATGTWYKLAVKEAGIYKIDLSFLNSLGINTSSLSSNSHPSLWKWRSNAG